MNRTLKTKKKAMKKKTRMRKKKARKVMMVMRMTRRKRSPLKQSKFNLRSLYLLPITENGSCWDVFLDEEGFSSRFI